MDAKEASVTFETILAAEREEIKKRRAKTGSSTTDATESDFVGLAFSGGGIRSATFNLGVLQALAKAGILSKIDYLSTVSGGGYIGSWLITWLKRTGARPEELLRREQTREAPQIKWLRKYSNYLTPQKSFFSADTWAAVSVYLRNFLLNLAIIIPAFVGALLLTRLAVGSTVLSLGDRTLWQWIDWIVPFVLLAVSAGMIGRNLALIGRIKRKSEKYPEIAYPKSLAFTLLSLIAVASVFLSHEIVYKLFVPPSLPIRWLDRLWQSLSLGSGIFQWMLWGGAGYITFWAVGGYVFSHKKIDLQDFSRMKNLVAGLFAGAVFGTLLWGLHMIHGAIGSSSSPTWRFIGESWVAWSPVAVLSAFMVTCVFHIGVAGSVFSEEMREWWSRIGGWLLIMCLAWLAVFGFGLYSPLLLRYLGAIEGWAAQTLTMSWLASTLFGVLAGKSDKTGKKESNKALEVCAKIAPYASIIGLLVFLAVMIQVTLGVFLDENRPTELDILQNTNYLYVIGATVFCFAFAYFLSWRVGVNEFSMHAFYLNRLVRCYLGASNETRVANPVTGFSLTDDIYPLQNFVVTESDAEKKENEKPYIGPYPIINTAINLVHGKELAWQQRRAASFAFTPLYCGYVGKPRGKDTGMRDEAEYYARTPRAIHVGLPMAISGAAVSPNMGFHSSAPLAFLMTVFNARLGWWFPNTAETKMFANPASETLPRPKPGYKYLLAELFGLTNEEREFVYLSDGGHFENLGLYELVRRRCKYIIVSDAGCDGAFSFQDLGNAIEKCRADLQTDINIRIEKFRPDRSVRFGESYCAIGSIRYPPRDGEPKEGILLYIKSSLTGAEPSDVYSYAQQFQAFPHESTGDQFFSESQFESYRALGYQCAEHTLFSNTADSGPLGTLTIREVFERIKTQWGPTRKGSVT